MHSKDEKYVITCLISKFQSNYLKRIVKETDDKAFVYSSAVSEVMGYWTKDSELPREEKPVSKLKKTIDKKNSNKENTIKQNVIQEKKDKSE
jgi:hypothetical protein